jgi:hypothetical protein
MVGGPRDPSVEEILASEREYTVEDQEHDGVIDEAADEPHSTNAFKISSYGADYTVDSLVKRMESKAFFIPSFQRSYVWTQRQASRFIESLLLGLPVPGIFVFKEEGSARHLVIDGQQRLKTLHWFYSGVFRERVFRLVDVNDAWVGKTYKDLSEDDRQRLDDAVVHTTVFKQDDPKDRTSVFHVFERINTGGVRLQPQEIRNCIYYGAFTELLEALNDNADWRAIYGKKNDRLKDRELILRFLALYYTAPKYSRPMKDFLNTFISSHRNPTEEEQDEFRKSFEAPIKLVRSVLGRKAFRPGGSLNAAVFDAVMVGLATRLAKGPVKEAQEIRAKYDELLESEGFKTAYTRATADEESVSTRLKLAVSAFARCK